MLSELVVRTASGDSYLDAIENLFASHRTVLVLSFKVEDLDFLHDYLPLLFGVWNDN